MVHTPDGEKGMRAPSRLEIEQYIRERVEYDRKLIEYQSRLVDYRQDIELWRSFPPKKRDALDRVAEENSRRNWSLIAALVASVWLYNHLFQKFVGDDFLYIWGGASIGVFVTALLLSQLFGPLMRGIAYAVIVGVISEVGGDILRSNVSHPPSNHLLTIGVFTLSGIAFVAGIFAKESGKPEPPAPPVVPRTPTIMD